MKNEKNSLLQRDSLLKESSKKLLPLSQNSARSNFCLLIFDFILNNFCFQSVSVKKTSSKTDPKNVKLSPKLESLNFQEICWVSVLQNFMEHIEMKKFCFA